MAKLTAEQNARLEELTAAKDAAKADRDANPCPETREAYSAAYNALSAYAAEVTPAKKGSYASRAGKRQAAERRAMQQSARAGRRWK